MNDQKIIIKPFYLKSPRGPLFCLYLTPTDKLISESILYLPPFAEEMHKSRRMAALQARAMAHAGYAVLQLDLTGCGDSISDFGEATWDAWRDDVRLAYAWLTSQTNGPITLWGLRIGASLAVDIAPTLTNISRLLLWQPVISGKQFITQFLRIKLANEMLSEGQVQTGTKNLWEKLEMDQSFEVGGYMLSPGMACNLSKLALVDLRPTSMVEWIEVGNNASDDITPAGQNVVEAWHNAKILVHTQAVQGKAFWSTQEITECPDLIEATMKVLAQ